MTREARVATPSTASGGRVRRGARLLRRFVVLELRLYGSLARWVSRRPDVPAVVVGLTLLR